MYVSSANSQTQWYTDDHKSNSNLSHISDTVAEGSDDAELGDQKSASRPSSGQFNNRASIQSHLSLVYRCNPSLSVGYPNFGNEVEDDETPPPLPAKQSADGAANRPTNHANI